MVATIEPRVEIDDRIKANAALLQAVNDATAFFGRQGEGATLPAALRWQLLPLDPGRVEFVVSDLDDFSDVTSRRVFGVAELADTYSRQSGMLRAWSDLLRLRSERQSARVDAYIKDLNRVLSEQGESNP